MQNLIIAALSRKRPRAVVGYALTVMLISVVLLLELSFPLALHRYLPFLPAVLVAAVAFGRNAGFFATLLSIALVNGMSFAMPGRFAWGWPELVFLLLFVVIAVGISILAATVGQAVRELRRTEAEKSLLLDELAHRTRNDLMMVASVLSLQAHRQTDPQVRAALDSAVARVHVIAEAQERLRNAGKQGEVELAGYLQALGHCLSELLHDVRPIVVRVRATPMMVGASVAVSTGLMMNELVTNAFKYAFPDGEGGEVLVNLRRVDHGIELAVEDDGVGCSSKSAKGLGSHLVKMLAAQLGGQVERPPVLRGHHVRITLPIQPAEPAPDITIPPLSPSL